MLVSSVTSEGQWKKIQCLNKIRKTYTSSSRSKVFIPHSFTVFHRRGQPVYICLIPNTVHMIHHCFKFFVMFLFIFLWWLFLVCPEQLNCPLFFQKILRILQILWFSSIFCISEPLQVETVWCWEPSFHTDDNWGTHSQQLHKRFKRSLMLQKETRCIKSWRWKLSEFEDKGKLNLFCLLGNM